MRSPNIYGNRATYSASEMLDTLGASLARIKADNRLTDEDVGGALGRSADMAVAYRNGTSDMPASVLFKGVREFGPDLIADALAKLGYRLAPLADETTPDVPSLACDLTGTAHDALATYRDRVIKPFEARRDLPGVEAALAQLEAYAATLHAVLASNKPRSVA